MKVKLCTDGDVHLTGCYFGQKALFATWQMHLLLGPGACSP